MPKPNEGTTDRLVRVVLGVVLLGLAYYSLHGTAQTVAVVAGVVALVTGLIGFCGLYKILGISTVGKK